MGKLQITTWKLFKFGHLCTKSSKQPMNIINHLTYWHWVELGRGGVKWEKKGRKVLGVSSILEIQLLRWFISGQSLDITNLPLIKILLTVYMVINEKRFVKAIYSLTNYSGIFEIPIHIVDIFNIPLYSLFSISNSWIILIISCLYILHIFIMRELILIEIKKTIVTYFVL